MLVVLALVLVVLATVTGQPTCVIVLLLVLGVLAPVIVATVVFVMVVGLAVVVVFMDLDEELTVHEAS